MSPENGTGIRVKNLNLETRGKSQRFSRNITINREADERT